MTADPVKEMADDHCMNVPRLAKAGSRPPATICLNLAEVYDADRGQLRPCKVAGAGDGKPAVRKLAGPNHMCGRNQTWVLSRSWRNMYLCRRVRVQTGVRVPSF